MGLLLGVLMPLGLLPLWQTLGLPAFTPPVEILPVIYAVPAWEETVFRGILSSALVALLVRDNGVKRLQLIGRKALALVLSAAVFAACHMITYPSRLIWSSLGATHFLDFAISGLLFGIVRMCSGSLLPGMVMHAATNLVEWILMFELY
jgi:membrane protease YdiL (CAAX protease family)